MSTKSKPAGIVLIAIWSAVCGLASVPIGCSLSFLAGVPEAAALSVVGMLICALGVLFLASVYGLWTLQPWGRTFSWWLYLACIPLGLAAIFPMFPGQQMSVGNTLLQLLGIGIDVAVLFYLAKPTVRALFGSQREREIFEAEVTREPR